MTLTGTVASIGTISRVNDSGVISSCVGVLCLVFCSHCAFAAWWDAFRLPRAFPASPPWARSVPAAHRLASVAGPARAKTVPCSLRISGKQSSQYRFATSSRIVPQLRHVAGTVADGCGFLEFRFLTFARPALRFDCVSGVGSLRDDVADVGLAPECINVCVMPSTIGANAAVQRGAVSASIRVTGGISRHAPCRVPKKSPVPNRPDCISLRSRQLQNLVWAFASCVFSTTGRVCNA